MYRLEFHLPRRYRTEQVAATDMRRISRGRENRGFFNHNGSFNVPGGQAGQERLVVNFDPVIFLASGLDPTAREEVLDHEVQHYNDFVDLVNPLRRYLQRAVRRAPWAELHAAWRWFLYDYCYASAQFHRDLGRTSVELCNSPNAPRPY